MKLEAFLQQHGIKYQKDIHAKTYTAQELAHEEHISGYMVAKPVIVKAASGFVMCVLPAPRHLSLSSVADLLGEKEVRLASESEMEKLFPDCELGAEPPVGAMFGMKTIMDIELKQDEFLVMQAGTHTEAVEISREDWERLCEPEAADIALS